MADVELTGRIKLTADTTQAKKDAEKIGEAGADAAKSTEAAVIKPVQEAVKNIGSSISLQLKEVFSKVQGAMSSIGGGMAGAMGGVLGSAASGAAGVGGSVAGIGGAAVAGGGPVGIALGIVVALGAASVAAVIGIKALTQSVIDFARGLSDSSPLLAQLFSEFDVEMMQLERIIGDAIAPALRNMLGSLLTLGQDLLPYLVSGIQLVIGGLTQLFRAIHEVVNFVDRTVVNPMQRQMAHALGMSMGNEDPAIAQNNPFHKLLDQFGGIGALVPIERHLEKILGIAEDMNNRDLTGQHGQGVMGAFMDSMNNPNSPQAQYQKEFYQQRGLPIPNVKVPPRKPGG